MSRCVDPRSYYLVTLTTRAAVFMTSYNLSVTVLDVLPTTSSCSSPPWTSRRRGQASTPTRCPENGELTKPVESCHTDDGDTTVETKSAKMVSPSNHTWSQTETVSAPSCRPTAGPRPWSCNMLYLDPIQSNSAFWCLAWVDWHSSSWEWKSVTILLRTRSVARLPSLSCFSH